MIPGLTAAVETFEAAFRWGPAGQTLITGGVNLLNEYLGMLGFSSI